MAGEKRILESLRSRPQNLAPIATDMFLPNHSGIKTHPEFKSALSTLIPAGTIVMYGGSTAPSGWLLCNGDIVLKSQYPELYAVIGDSFGTYDVLHFVLPLFDFRFPMGKGGVYGIGDYGGEAEHTLDVSELPAHSHGLDHVGLDVEDKDTGENGIAVEGKEYFETIYPFGGQITDETGDGAAHNNLPPYLVVNFIIKT